METKNEIVKVITKEDLLNVVERIKEFSKTKNLILNEEPKFKSELVFSSKSEMKDLRIRLKGIEKKISRKRINTLFAFLYKKNLIDNKCFLDLTEKEKKIQELRKNWKEAFKKSEELRLIYKEEKGDFYKK